MTLNEKIVREFMEKAKDALDEIEQERENLITMVRSCEEWLRINSGRINGTTLSSQISQKETRRSTGSQFTTKGSMSLRAGILQTVRDARGAPLHVTEIWRRMEAQGAKSDAADPINVVGTITSALRRRGEPIEQVAPRTWRWVEPPSNVTSLVAGSPAESDYDEKWTEDEENNRPDIMP